MSRSRSLSRGIILTLVLACGSEGDLPVPISNADGRDVGQGGEVSAPDTAPLADVLPAIDILPLPDPDAVAPPDDGSQVGEDVAEVDPCAEAPYGFLCPCQENDECGSGYCVPTIDPEAPLVCTVECVEDCPNDWPCQGVKRGPDLLFLCLPQADTLCNPCTTDAECGTHGERCLTYDDGQFCGRDCSLPGALCPGDTACESVSIGGLLERQCRPTSGSCLCGPEIDYTSDATNCGKCGRVCALDGATSLCEQSDCILGVCLDGRFDLDHDPSNGCEYACTPVAAADLPDDGVDQNCDGMDGDMALAWFVAPSGTDGAAGTAADPLRSLTEALESAEASPSRKQIYLAAGTWSGTVQLVEGVSVYGGFGLPTAPPKPGATVVWTRSPSAFQSTIQSSTVDALGDVRTVVIEDLTAALLDGLTIVSGNTTVPGGSSYGVWISGATAGVVLKGCSITAGAGAPGRPGEPGTIGKDGSVGGDGETTTTSDAFCNEFADYGGEGGKAGPATCPGGLGGGGQGADSACGDKNGNAGSPSPEGTPGGPFGSPGTGGADGAPGQPGQGGGLGSVTTAGRWASQAGGDGGPGEPGKGGGGGSSGKGDDGGTFGSGSWGGGGGGGGSAGCAGTGGLGGTGGGGSFAVFVVKGNPTLQANVFIRGAGGKGGDGGKPGPGGLGKDGGKGGGGNADAGDGKPGGKGGNGGGGGAGGGGAGGPSYGLFIGESASPACAQNTYEQAGTGGAGGASESSPGKAGLAGDKNKPTPACL